MTGGAVLSASSATVLCVEETTRSAAMMSLGMWVSVRKRRHARSRFGIVALLTGLMVVCLQAEAGLDAPMVLTQVPQRTANTPAGWDPKGLVRGDWFEGARLALVSANGQARVLSGGFDSACDPCVSFDGQRLLFAGRKTRQDPWRVWEMALDGQGLHAVSPENMDVHSPLYVSTLFTLNSPEPWFTTVFVGRETTMNEIGRGSGSSLYNIKLDGTELRRLTFNPNHNFDPFQMWDGRVIYSAERYPNEPGQSRGRVSLYAIHVEGADMERYGGELGGRIQHMPCGTAGGLVLFVESNESTWDGAGQLACVEERRPHTTYKQLTKDADYLFLHPSPLRDNRVLVSRRSANGAGSCGVCSFDADRGQCEPLFDSPEFHDVQAVLAKPRTRPDGHSTVVSPKSESGVFYGLNCYTANAEQAAHLRDGAIKRVRFIEGVLRTATKASHQGVVQGPFVPRRLIGEAPVEADGSFNVEVPADTPLLLQTLDERGLALGNCGWIWVKPKESRGCIGCHEDPGLIPQNEYVLALRRPSNRLLLPPTQRRSVAFREHIAPTLKTRCATAECHAGSETPLRLLLGGERPTEADIQAAYAALMVPAEGRAEESSPQPGRYVDAGRARTSWLIWQLTGTNTARPWDESGGPVDAPARRVTQMPPPGNGAPFSAEELHTLVQWIDLGAQYEAVTP